MNKILKQLLNIAILLTWVATAHASDVIEESDVDIYRKAIADSYTIKICLDRVPDVVTPESMTNGQELKDRMIANMKERTARSRIQVLIDRWGIQNCGELVSLVSISPSGSYYFPANVSRPAQYCLFTDRKNSTGNHVSPDQAVITCEPQPNGNYFCRDRENEDDYARVFDRAEIEASVSIRANQIHKRVRVLEAWSAYEVANMTTNFY